MTPSKRVLPRPDAGLLIQESHEARALLEHPLFQRACRAVEENILTAWREAKTTELREKCHFQLTGLSNVLVQLQLVLTRGEEEQELAERTAATPRTGPKQEN